MKEKSIKPFLGWRMVVIALSIDFFAVGFSFQSYPVIQLLIKKELGLSTLMTTSTIPAFMLISSLLLPFVGKLLDTFSIRKVLLVGALIYGMSLISLYFAYNFFAFVLIFAIPIAIGVALMGNLSVSKLITQWFSKKVGRAIGIASIGVSLAGFVIPNLTNYLLFSIGFTWREVYFLFGSFILIFIIPLIWFFVIDSPKLINQIPDGEDNTEKDAMSLSSQEVDWSIIDLLYDKNFWLLSLVFSLQFCSMMAVLAHIPFYAEERGWGSYAAFIFSMYAIPAVLSKLVFGWLVERKMDPRAGVSISLVIQTIGILLIFITNTPYQLACVIAFFGFGLGAALPMSNILFSRVYTPRSFGRSRGLAQPMIVPFQVSGTPLAAYLFDIYGNYDLAFLILAGCSAVGIFLIWLLKLPKSQLT